MDRRESDRMSFVLSAFFVKKLIGKYQILNDVVFGLTWRNPRKDDEIFKKALRIIERFVWSERISHKGRPVL